MSLWEGQLKGRQGKARNSIGESEKCQMRLFPMPGTGAREADASLWLHRLSPRDKSFKFRQFLLTQGLLAKLPDALVQRLEAPLVRQLLQSGERPAELPRSRGR